MTSYAKRVRAVYPGARLRTGSFVGSWAIVTDDDLVLAEARSQGLAWALAANALEPAIEGKAVEVAAAPWNAETTVPAGHPLIMGIDFGPRDSVSVAVGYELLGGRVRIVRVETIDAVRQPRENHPAFDAFVARLSKGETE